jgi:hypothetical protein
MEQALPLALRSANIPHGGKNLTVQVQRLWTPRLYAQHSTHFFTSFYFAPQIVQHHRTSQSRVGTSYIHQRLQLGLVGVLRTSGLKTLGEVIMPQKLSGICSLGPSLQIARERHRQLMRFLNSTSQGQL